MGHGRGGVAAFVSNDGEVVVAAGMARIDREGALEKIARFGGAPGGLLHEREIHQRFDVAGLGGERLSKLSGGSVETSATQQGNAEIVVRLRVSRIDDDRALELLDRVVDLALILVQQPEIVVHFRAGVVLFEERAVLGERVVEVADALVVQREVEVIGWGRPGRRRQC